MRFESNLATKQDLKDLATSLSQDFMNLRHEFQQMEANLTIKLGAMLVTGVAVISALIEIF